MSSPSVLFSTSDGRATRVFPSGILGRMSSAALRVVGPGISEAHALISLRGAHLWCLALRGKVQWRTEPGVPLQSASELMLEPGMEIVLGETVVLMVEDVVLPDMVHAIVGLPGGARPLLTGQASLTIEPTVSLDDDLSPDAALWVWMDGQEWMVQVPGEAPRSVSLGDVIWEGPPTLRLGTASLAGQGTANTHGELGLPLVIEAWREQTIIRAPGGRPVVLSGKAAAIVRELVLYRVPTHWREVAEQVWADADVDLRANFDRNRKRVAARLKSAGLRHDLLGTRGDGHYFLKLGPQDRLLDRTFEDLPARSPYR